VFDGDFNTGQMLYIVQEQSGHTEAVALQMCRAFIDGYEPKTLTVEVKDVHNNPDNDFTWGGNLVTFKGHIYNDFGDPMEGLTVQISYPFTGDGKGGNGVGQSNSQGYYEVDIEPWHGQNPLAYAHAHILGWGNEIQATVDLPLYGLTRVTVQASPDPVEPGSPLTVSGILEWQGLRGEWQPVQGATINVEATGSPGDASETAVTQSDGSYQAQITPQGAGTWTIVAAFPGSVMLIGSYASMVLNTNGYAPTKGLTKVALPLLAGVAIYKLVK
jgi:hypothetical protein